MSFLVNRIFELSQKAYKYNMPVFSEFLDLAEINECKQSGIEKEPVIVCYSQVFKDDERQLIGFFPTDYDSLTMDQLLALFPITVFKISPSFEDTLNFNHRDLLGSIMGLNIERKMIGDIIVYEDEAFFQCHERMSQLILDELVFAKKQSISLEPVSLNNVKTIEPRSKELYITVASLRLDGIIKGLSHVSRASASALIERGNVKINQVVATKIHQSIMDGDILSIKGSGKFKILTTDHRTKTGRIRINYLQYI